MRWWAWTAGARVAESACRLFRLLRQRPVKAAFEACGALLGLVALVLVLGCAPTPGPHGTGRVGATGGAGASTTTTAAPTATSLPCPTATTATGTGTGTGTGSTASPPAPQQQQLAAAVAAGVGNAGPGLCLDTTYTAADRTAMVTVTIAGLVPTTPAAIAAAQERSKVLCFQAQQAVWTRSGVALRAATVAVVGPYLDPYDGLTTVPYASASLTARTAVTFAWANLSPDSAWGKYDATFLRPGFDPTDGQPTATP